MSLRADALEAFAVAFARRLTVVCAPAGYGKTTVTAAALQHCDRAAAWYKLDILDHDPLAFLASLTRAVQRLDPGFGAALLDELDAGPVMDLPVEALAARFCSECDRRITADHHIVIDDYHEAMDSGALNSVLGYLLENCPDTVHFVVLTRYEPAFRLEKLHLAGEVSRLPRDLLVFDAGQVADVIERRSGRRHDPAHVQRLLEITEGWPASVVLAGMALAWLDVGSLHEALGDPRLRGDVFSYLAEQVFQRQSEDVRQFLIGTCCLEHVTVELAEALTASGNASRHLNFLARNQVFTFDTDRSGAYRYHNLLRDFLRQRFVQEEGKTAFRALQRRTAVALEESGDRPGAIELLLGANEPELALDVIARGGEAELERRPYHQLRHWVSQLQPPLELGQPWALVVSGVLATRDGRFDEALSDLRAAEQSLLASGDQAGLYDVLSIIEWAEFWSGDSAGSMETCKQALEHASRDSQRLHTLLSLMSAAVDLRRWHTVDEASGRADAHLGRAGPEEAARANALKAHAAYFQGDMPSAHSFIRRSQSHGGRATQKAAALNIQGMIETALADYEQARQHLDEAAITARDFGHALTSYMIEDSQACLACAQGETGTCLEALQTLLSEGEHVQETSLRAYSLCHLGTALRRSGDSGASIEPTRQALNLAPMSRDPYLALNGSANLYFAEGLLGDESVNNLGAVSKQARRLGLRFVELKALLFQAVLHEQEERRATAVHALEACLPDQLGLGHVNLVAQELSTRPTLASEVLRRHRKNGLGPTLVEALSHHWMFEATASILKELCPSQVSTWIDAVGSKRYGSARGSRSRLDAPRRQRADGSTSLGLLTARELQVLELMAANLTNSEIADELFIAVSTVKTHVNHILQKLEQKTRVGAILEYQRLSRQVMNPPRTANRNLHPPP